MTSLRGMLLATLFSLALLETHLTVAAPTHASLDHSVSSASSGAHTTTTSSITTHRSTSHPIWHLLLALWRPKDATTASSASATETYAHEYAFTRDGHHAVPLPSAARQIQLPQKDGTNSDPGSSSDSDTHTDPSVIVTSTPEHSIPDTQPSETQQHPDPDTPHHPTLNKQKTQHSDANTQQHPDTPQHPTLNTKQKTGPKTTQHPDLNTQKHTDSNTQQHPAEDTEVLDGERDILQHLNSETQQHPDHDTPQHPTRKNQQHQASNTTQLTDSDSLPQDSNRNNQQHLEPEQQHPDHDTLQHQAQDTQQHPDPDTPQHPMHNTQQKTIPSAPQHPNPDTQQHSASEIQEHLDPDTPEHPNRKTQQVSVDTEQHSDSDALKYSAGMSQEYTTPESQQHTSPATQQHSAPDTPHHPKLITQEKPNQQHPASDTHTPRPTQDAQENPTIVGEQHPESSVPRHPTRNTEQKQHTAQNTKDNAAPPYSSISLLHPPHAQYHPTPHTEQTPTTHTEHRPTAHPEHRPVLHIQPHPTSQTQHHPTLTPQLLPGTPWRLPHSDVSLNLQEEGEDSSSHDFSDKKTPAASENFPLDTVHGETLGGREHNESSHPAVMGSHGAYPAAERSPHEQDSPPVEPKLDDHFFLHPMPHYRDVSFTSPPIGHPDAMDTTTSSSPLSVEVGQDLSTTNSNSPHAATEAQETEEDQAREELPLHIEENLDQDASAFHSRRGKKVLQLQGPVVMESIDYSSLVPLVGQSREMLTLRDNETTVLAMLKVAQTSGGSRDTLQANAMIQPEDLGGAGDGRYTEVSHRDGLPSLEAGVAGTTTAKLVQTESGGRDMKAVLIKKDSKSLDIRKAVNAIDTTADKNQVDVTHGQDPTNVLSTTKPIYEEISGALKVDTSIDDVEDFDVQIKHTEHSDDFLPPANTSHINLIDVSLHSQNPSDLPDTNESSLPSTLTPSSLTDTQTSQTPTPQTFSNYPSHYPPKFTISQETDATTVAAGDGGDSWSPFVANFSSLDNTTLSLNASLIQRSHVLSLEEHYKMVLRERGSLMLQLMDPSADPCEDFYQFACGRWNGKFPIRQDKAVDNTFERLKEDLDDVLRSLLEEEPLPSDNNITVTVKTLYAGCMNTEAIEAMGAEPLLALLRELGGWPVLEGDAWNNTDYDWVRQMARLRNYNNDILISEWVAADITNSSNHIIQLDQPELGLPGREYFINPGDYQYREAYLDLMLNVAQMLGAPLPVALKDMTEVLHFETHLSRILTPAEERRNLSAVHRRLTVDQLSEEVPEIDWAQYLDIITWHNNHSGEVVVFGLDYFKKLVSSLEYTDDRTVSNYLLWRFVKNRISNLGERYTKVKQDYIKVLFGRQSQPERWRSCVTYVSGNLGYVVGAMFVKRYFPEASKNDTDEMIGLIRESFGSALQAAHWMNEETRQVAQEKVNTIVKNVGYPEYLLNDTYMDQVYSELSFNRETHFENVLKMLQFHARTNHDLLSVPVNRTAWVTSPAVVNAYYSRSKNMIVFPAGILQPPFYHPAFPRSLNYGGIGVVIGHEITHGFDDRGRQFDKNGNLQQWWTPSDVSQFYQRASCMLDQYGEYEVDEVGLKINPVNTLGENIADNAGIKISYQAYQNWRKNNEETVTLPFVNLTHDQLFFLNFGQIWCEINSPEAMLTKIRSGQHSPNRFRVIGTLSNSEEFSEAFSCPLGSAMNPERKCRVW
ncbi:mucin-3B-like isoform X2 [Scylla paramamosain]|uniref:mucin-3B-like isoform X2 n=1 Tax=Scylla paramamosain TaxID=85552 RepID=UPI00308379B6